MLYVKLFGCETDKCKTMIISDALINQQNIGYRFVGYIFTTSVISFICRFLVNH